MSQSKKQKPDEDLMASLLEELEASAADYQSAETETHENEIKLVDDQIEGLEGLDDLFKDSISSNNDDELVLNLSSEDDSNLLNIQNENQNDQLLPEIDIDEKSDFGILDLGIPSPEFSSTEPQGADVPPLVSDHVIENKPASAQVNDILSAHHSDEKTVALSTENTENIVSLLSADGEKTLAVAGFSNRSSSHQDENVKISVGQSSGLGYGGWGSTDSNLAQAENLKIAQAKILDLEKENEKLRLQNEELISATEIIKERSDLLTAQIYEYKNDRESLEQSFKNELALAKSQLNRKDAELQKAQMKIDELDSRLKFDMKKIRVRERELENRLELIRAEKNALMRSKDDQILDLRRKLDQLQLEVDSFRQKCVELNRVIETNQESFKRTTRALRLAMANLELQEENKVTLKKVD